MAGALYEIGSLLNSTTQISEMVLRKSTNDGGSWTQFIPMSGESYAYSVLPHPTNDAIIYLGGYLRQSGTQYPVLFKTTDRGATWSKSGTSTFTQTWESIDVLECDNANPNTVFAGSNYGLYVTSDGGASWMKILNGVDVSSVVIDPANSNHLYMGTHYSGVKVSTNRGATWSDRNENLGSLNVESMSYDGVNGVLYVGTKNSGVFRLSIAATPLSVPQPPALLAPADMATNIPVNTTLTWDPSAGATQYHVQVSVTNMFTALIADDSTITGMSKAVSALSPGMSYYWRVRGKNSVGWGAFSSTRLFTTAQTLAAPTLSAPADNAVNIPLNTTLIWSPVTGATSYHAQLSTSASFVPLIADDSTVIGTSRSVGPLLLATTYYWRVHASNAAGSGAFSPTRQFKTVTAVGITDAEDQIPRELILMQNYPNPFNPSTTIRFGIPEAAYVSVKLYTVLGELVATLVSSELPAGYHSVQWNAEGVPSGIYLCRVEAKGHRITSKLTVLR